MKKKEFSERLAEALSIREMTAAQLSRKTGIPEGTISCYKKGLYEAKQNRLWQIACALDVNPAWLMGYDVPMDRESEADNPYLTLAQVIKKYRKKKNLSEYSAAAQLDISVEKLNQYESEKIPIEGPILPKMIQLYNIPEEEWTIASNNDLLTYSLKESTRKSAEIFEAMAASVRQSGNLDGTTIFFEGIFLTESQIQEVRQFAAFVYQRDLSKDSNQKG